MAEQAINKKTSPEDVLQLIKESVENSEDRIFEASLTDLGRHFGIEAGTMNYHLNKLEEDGLVKLIDNKGKYRRKRYVLPEDYDLLIGLGSTEEFKQYVKEKKKSDEVSEVSTHQDVESTKTPVVQLQVERKEPQRELTLDESIQLFLQRSQEFDDAHVLLKQKDKDILAVMNETIQQNIIYLKDLSDQLSTIETKKLFFSLIEEREALQKENEELKKRLENKKETTPKESSISPERVRQMQQIIVSTVDNYINLPNHSVALQRLDFRNNITKELKDLVDYTLGLED